MAHRVRGASQVKERKWGSGRGKNFAPYRVNQYDWIDRLNTVRREYGDKWLAERLGVSTTDPTFKTVRRWSSGERVPSREVYEQVNSVYNRVKKKALKDVRSEILKSISGKRKSAFDSKLDYFIRKLGSFRYLKPDGNPNVEPNVTDTKFGGSYLETVNANGKPRGGGKNAIVFLSVFEKNRRTQESEQKAYLIERVDAPSRELLQNAVDSWIDRIPEAVFESYPGEEFDTPRYMFMNIAGVWFSYA